MVAVRLIAKLVKMLLATPYVMTTYKLVEVL